MGKKKRSSGIIVIAVLLIAVTLMYTVLVLQMTTRQTRESGIYQLESMSGELEAVINEAENETVELALIAQQLLGDREELRRFIFEKKNELAGEEKGCFNVYIAGTGWDIIPDLVRPEGYEPTDRGWYKGAIKNQGRTFVTSPYVDAATGDICYTVAVMLPDGDTVFSMDYTVETIQTYVSQMGRGASMEAVVVTGEGVIAGCTDTALIGHNINEVLPEYSGVFSLARNSNEVETLRVKSGFMYENLFAVRSGAGWYLIVNESDWELYRESYVQFTVTVVLSLMLLAIILILFVLSARSQKRAEDAVASKEAFLRKITVELQEPIHRILSFSGGDDLAEAEDMDVRLARINRAGNQLSEMIGQILSYSSLQKTGEQSLDKVVKGSTLKKDLRRRTLILTFMIVAMVFSMHQIITSAYMWGNEMMHAEVNSYENRLSEWISTQKGILDMFCSIISSNPDMLDDYEGTVAYLNRITEQYPEISVSYISNPELEHTVYMNNGWEPDDDWKVEERQWYIDTLVSESGWSISAPYFDEQTGMYCVTMSERVYDNITGEFLGNFGIDFYMDKLVDILGSSYSDRSYAFLVDAGGEIINHPYGSYQMSYSSTTNISELPYGALKADGESILLIRDYDQVLRILMAKRNEESNFRVLVAGSFWIIYGRIIVVGIICFIIYLICSIMVFRLLTDMIYAQNDAREQMKKAIKSAVAAGEAKGRFLAQMSHEIRTPINAVLGMNEMILREANQDNILDYAENIQVAGRTLLSLINSILDFSKIEDGKMEIIPADYDTASMISNLVNSVSERARAKGLDFIVNVDERLPVSLFGDDVRISQVIVNLLTNAVKYTEKGSVTLTLSLKEKRDDRIVLFVSVKDTGIGIRKEDMGKLFESFERLDEIRNRNIEGTGLGISIVTRLLEMMGSHLEVESVYGEGSVFYFDIEQQVVNGQPMGDYEKRRSNIGRSKQDDIRIYAPEARVLVVDDNAMNLKVAANLMKLSGIKPDTASSGQEAIDLVSEKKYQIIFMDHMMPRMDGIETLARMRGEKLLDGDTVVIALTANAVTGAQELYRDAGFDDYLSKPIEIAQLVEKLEKYLPESEKRDIANEPRTQGEPRTQIEPRPQGASEKTPDKPEEPQKQAEPEEPQKLAEPEEPQKLAEPEEPQKQADVLEMARASGEIMIFEPDEEDDPDDILPPPADSGVLNYRAPDISGPAAAAGAGRAEEERIKEELEENGVDVQDALRYCADDMGFYLEMLDEFVTVSPEKESELIKFFDEKDWHKYRITSHTLKSLSKTVGFKELSEKARVLEEASSREDADFIEGEHEKLMSMLREATDMIGRITGRA